MEQLDNSEANSKARNARRPDPCQGARRDGATFGAIGGYQGTSSGASLNSTNRPRGAAP